MLRNKEGELPFPSLMSAVLVARLVVVRWGPVPLIQSQISMTIQCLQYHVLRFSYKISAGDLVSGEDSNVVVSGVSSPFLLLSWAIP